LGICAGMQIIGMVFGGKVKSKVEIGFYKENFSHNFLGLVGEKEVYHLHNNFVDFRKLKEFDIFAESKCVVQAVKHKEKEIYGVLFHPEVRQKELISLFVKT
jgi:GMP synthase-like glutamine amidotransferase